MAENGDSAGKHTDAVKEHLKKHSKANIDEYIQATTFSNDEVHELCTR